MGTESSLSDILNSLMQNPEVMKAVSSIAEGTKNTDDAKEMSAEAEPQKTDGEGFTIPPELLSSLPQMMSALSGLGASSGISGNKGSVNEGDGKRKALLCALKPYLSDKRCALIDGLLQFEGLAGVLSTFQNK